MLTTLLTNTNDSHKSHKHKPNERTTEEPTNKQHPENTSPPSPPQLQTKPNPKISHTSKKNWNPPLLNREIYNIKMKASKRSPDI
jgi:hypothetical protein